MTALSLQFSDDDSSAALDEKAKAARRRVLNSAMMQDALYYYKDTPDAIHNVSTLQSNVVKKMDEIERSGIAHFVVAFSIYIINGVLVTLQSYHPGNALVVKTLCTECGKLCFPH